MVVIVLVALLCTLLAALALQCALRRNSRRGGEAADTTGLREKALRRIPVAEYGQGVVDLPTSMECSICLAEFADGERVRVLPRCNHGFHVRCIDTWLAAHSSCPTCRHSLRPSLAEEGRAC